ncbi:MAG: hypothetical protein GXP21_02275 [Gammaproteobacteria bacterium]|nr:hypothetical protein [Gammaproteobacteria bacterium]
MNGHLAYIGLSSAFVSHFHGSIHWLWAYIAYQLDSESYRVPLVLQRDAYALPQVL